MIRMVLMGVVMLSIISGVVYGALKEGPWPSDPELAKVEAEKEKKEQPCKKIKNIMREMDCYDEVRAGFYAKGLIRGTEQYVDLHYVDLSTKELIATRDALLALKAKARTRNDAKFDRVLGELSEEDLATEIQHIEIEMGRRAHEKFQENQKFLKGLQNK